MLDVIGDLERTVISGIEGGSHGDGNSSILKLKELVRVLCGELSVAEFTENCSSDILAEDVPRRRTGSAVVETTPKVPIGASDWPLQLLDGCTAVDTSSALSPPPPIPGESCATPTRPRRQSSVSELLAQPDSDDDLSASPRPQSKKIIIPNNVKK